MTAAGKTTRPPLLPLMFIGLDGLDAERRSQPVAKCLAEVKKRAKTLDVRLENTESGRKFVFIGRGEYGNNKHLY